MENIFSQYILLVPSVAWIVAVVVKASIHAMKKEFSLARALGSGGMPSVHSALVTSLTTAIGIRDGIWDELFAVCLVFSAIIIYDAINVRFEAGRHAKALNEIGHSSESYNELIGHLPNEAFAGALIGIMTAFVLVALL